jgi:hypothetical protein
MPKPVATNAPSTAMSQKPAAAITTSVTEVVHHWESAAISSSSSVGVEGVATYTWSEIVLASS